MNCLLYCSEILAVLLFIPWSAYAEDKLTSTSSSYDSSESNYTPSALSVTSSESNPSTVSTMSSEKTGSPTKSSTSVSPTQPSQTTTTLSPLIFLKKECFQVTVICGVLILACFFFLTTTLLLTWKVCQLRRELNMMSSSTELWVETDKKKQSEPEAEAKETTVLMADLSQTNQEMKNGSAKEDGGKVNEDGQTGKEKEDEAPPATEEASAAVESSSSLEPREEAGSSQPTAAAAAPPSEATEEPKGVP